MQAICTDPRAALRSRARQGRPRSARSGTRLRRALLPAILRPMAPYEVAAAFFTVLSFFGSITLIVRMAVNSPRRRALAEAEKQARLRDLGLLPGPGHATPELVGELRAQISDRDSKITELMEERDFLRKLLEERNRERQGPA